jgi:hypothetical protein
MLANFFSSAVLFRIINFAAFIGFCVFLFKHYFLPSIKKQIQEKKLLLQNLEQQKQGIKYLHNNLDNAIEQQKHLADELTEKITLWRTNVLHQQGQAQESQKLVLEKMHKKITQQNQEQDLVQLNKKIIPSVIKEVRETLAHHFGNNDASQPFIKDIITFIQESSS